MTENVSLEAWSTPDFVEHDTAPEVTAYVAKMD